MDIDVKQRLTGAAVLVALIVVVVPSLLTGPGSRESTAVEGTASTEPPLRAYTAQLDGTPTQGVAPQSREPAQPAGDNAPSLAPPVEGPSASPPPPAEPPTPARVERSKPQAAVPETGSSVAQKPEAGAKPADTPTEREAEGGASTARGWAIQVASFSARGNADRFARELQGKGFKAFVLAGRSSGKPVFRVRVGPERDRRAAEALAAKLKSSGRGGSIVSHP